MESPSLDKPSQGFRKRAGCSASSITTAPHRDGYELCHVCLQDSLAALVSGHRHGGKTEFGHRDLQTELPWCSPSCPGCLQMLVLRDALFSPGAETLGAKKNAGAIKRLLNRGTFTGSFHPLLPEGPGCSRAGYVAPAARGGEQFGPPLLPAWCRHVKASVTEQLDGFSTPAGASLICGLRRRTKIHPCFLLSLLGVWSPLAPLQQGDRSLWLQRSSHAMEHQSCVVARGRFVCRCQTRVQHMPKTSKGE